MFGRVLRPRLPPPLAAAGDRTVTKLSISLLSLAARTPDLSKFVCNNVIWSGRSANGGQRLEESISHAKSVEAAESRLLEKFETSSERGRKLPKKTLSVPTLSAPLSLAPSHTDSVSSVSETLPFS